MFPTFSGKNSRQGVAIYLAVAALSIVLAVALGVSLLSIYQEKNMNESGNSVVAFAAAETGIEWALYMAIDLTNYTTICPLGVCPVPAGGALGNANYSVAAVTSAESAACPAGILCIKSVGIYNGTQRVIWVQQ